MAKILTGSIELNKLTHGLHVTKKGTNCILIPLDQNGIFVSEKTGRIYLNTAVFVADEDDQHGNRASVTISQSKEQKDKGEPKIYLGNLKQVWEGDAQNTNQNNNTSSSKVTSAKDDDDDLPF